MTPAFDRAQADPGDGLRSHLEVSADLYRIDRQGPSRGGCTEVTLDV